MPLAISFTTTLSSDQYDEIWRQLRDAKADHPQGRLSHVGWEQDGTIRVVDVWDTMENFEAFGATLMPIIGSLGGEATPTIIEARHFQTT